MSRDVYIAIMRAAARGSGVHLTPDECFSLSLDDAIATCAANRLDASENVDNFDWAKCDPAKPRVAANQCIGGDQDDHRVWPPFLRS